MSVHIPVSSAEIFVQKGIFRFIKREAAAYPALLKLIRNILYWFLSHRNAMPGYSHEPLSNYECQVKWKLIGPIGLFICAAVCRIHETSARRPFQLNTMAIQLPEDVAGKWRAISSGLERAANRAIVFMVVDKTNDNNKTKWNGENEKWGNELRTEKVGWCERARDHTNNSTNCIYL